MSFFASSQTSLLQSSLLLSLSSCNAYLAFPLRSGGKPYSSLSNRLFLVCPGQAGLVANTVGSRYKKLQYKRFHVTGKHFSVQTLLISYPSNASDHLV